MEASTTKKSRLTWKSLVATLLVVALLVWLGLHFLMPAKTEKPAGNNAVPATTVKVATETVPIYLTGVGTAQAAASVTVKARVDGQLERVGFIEGQDVKAGQLLAKIDSRALEAQLEQVRAQQSKDAAQLANAKIDLARYSSLIKDDATTQQVLDTQRALVAQLEAAVKTDQAQIDYAKVQVDYTTIVAPLAGRVGARLVDPGNIVHAADVNGLVVINQIDPISVVFTLPDSTVGDINRALQNSHEPLAVYAYARETNQLLGQGTLILLNNQIDTTSGTVQLKGRFANPAHTLWPGLYVNVKLVLGQRQQALTVPSAVVQRGQNGTFAYLVDADQTVKMQAIDVAQIQDGKAVITKGLKAGDRVVVDGQYKIKPGVHITEVEKPGAAPTPAPAAAASTSDTKPDAASGAAK